MKDYHNSKVYSVIKDIWSILLTLSVFVYLYIGFVKGIWHPTWLIFVGVILISIVMYLVCLSIFKKHNKGKECISTPFDNLFEATIAYSKCVKISGWLFIASVLSYIIISSFTGLWHPLWLIFIGMAVVEQIVALSFKLIFKVNKDN